MENVIVNEELIQYRVRMMDKSEISQVIDILKETEWPVGNTSVYSWYEYDPEGWKVAVTNSGEILGLCCAVHHNKDFHFIGFYAVKEKYRGRGIGTKIWNACMEYIGSRNACLCASSDMLEKYQIRSGFSFIDENVIYSFETHEEVDTDSLSDENTEGIVIVPFEEKHLDAILDYDRSLGGLQSRQRAIKICLKEEGSKTLVSFKDGSCVGYATMKICLLNIPHLAPMYADDPNVAEAMLKKLLLSFKCHKGFSMSTFSANKHAVDMMKKIGCPKLMEWFHMYKKAGHGMDFKPSLHKLFSQFNLDFLEF